jgi:hypothetical protein
VELREKAVQVGLQVKMAHQELRVKTVQVEHQAQMVHQVHQEAVEQQ